MIPPKEDYRRARDLRNNASPFEKKLWNGIRAMMAVRKIRFRRQHAIHPFIVDFACLKARLVIELDGFSHDARLAYDRKRDMNLASRGFHVLRFRNEDVIDNLDGIVGLIFDTAEKLAQQK